MAKPIVRIQLLDKDTSEVLEEVYPETIAKAVYFNDGDSFQDKLNKGELKGASGGQGVQGQKGEQGAPFKIVKTYESIALMETDKGNLVEYDFVMIDTGNIEDIDNAKLYMKVGSTMKYITDLSGATGIQGPKGSDGKDGVQGPKGNDGEKGIPGEKGLRGVEGPQGADGYTPVKGVDYFDGEKGEKGETGERGVQGNTGKAGIAGQTGKTGEKGDPGKDGDLLKYGVTIGNAQEVQMFLKKME